MGDKKLSKSLGKSCHTVAHDASDTYSWKSLPRRHICRSYVWFIHNNMQSRAYKYNTRVGGGAPDRTCMRKTEHTLLVTLTQHFFSFSCYLVNLWVLRMHIFPLTIKSSRWEWSFTGQTLQNMGMCHCPPPLRPLKGATFMQFSGQEAAQLASTSSLLIRRREQPSSTWCLLAAAYKWFAVTGQRKKRRGIVTEQPHLIFRARGCAFHSTWSAATFNVLVGIEFVWVITSWHPHHTY